MEKKIFPKNYLTEVVLQVDFNNPVRLTSEMIKGIHNALPFEKKEYKENSLKVYEIKVEKENESLNIRQVGKSGSFFAQELEQPVKFMVDNEKFLFSVSKYSRFSSFFDIFLKGFKALQTINHVSEFKRLGLRYINIFVFDDEEIKSILDWRKYFKPAYIPNYEEINIEKTGLSIRRSMNRLIFGDGESFINAYFGVWNKSFPGMIVDKEFILDMDCYVDNKILSEDDVFEMPKMMSEKAYKCFYSIITDRLEEKLEEK